MAGNQPTTNIEYQRVRTKKSDAGASPHTALIELFTEAYQIQFERPYKFGGAKDGTAVKQLLAATKQTPAEIMAVITEAWRHANKGKAFWNCANATSLAVINSRWNEINAELSKVNGTKIDGPKFAKLAEKTGGDATSLL